MSNAVLKAIKDWCNGKFQHKGDYLIEVPEEYVTNRDLDSVVATMITTETLTEQYLGGVRLGKDKAGNPGYYKYDEETGADTVIPFSGERGDCGEFISPFSPARITTISSNSYAYQLLLLSNFHNFSKIKIKGRLSAKITTGSYTRIVTLSFQHQVKDENGNPVNMSSAVSLNLASATVKSTTESVINFEKEIDITNVWFPNYDEEPGSIPTACPRFCIGTDISSYVNGTAYLDKIVFCK